MDLIVYKNHRQKLSPLCRQRQGGGLYQPSLPQSKCLPVKKNDQNGAATKRFAPFSQQTVGLQLAIPWHTLVIALGLIILHYVCVPFNDLFIYNRTAVAQAQWWRVMTGHLVHYNFGHLFWNLVAFFIIGAVIEFRSRWQLYLSLLFSFSGVGVWLWLAEPFLMEYCGLSGALNGLLLTAVMLEWKENRNPQVLLVLIGAVAKIVFELTTHKTFFLQLGTNCQSVPTSHMAGFLSGLLYLAVSRFTQKKGTGATF